MFSFDPLIAQYREAFRRHGNSPDAVLWPKGRQYLRFERLTAHIQEDGFTILDFGCGLGHLKEYLDARFRKFRYFGVDLVPDFIAECRKVFPAAAFTEIKHFADVTGNYDYVVLSGVFNILYTPDHSQHLQVVCDTLEHLFQHTAVALSCDFMTDKVDFQQPGAFHLSETVLVEVVQGRLSRRYQIDHAYMPYEYAVTVYKDQRIVRPDHIFQGSKDGDSPAL